MGESKEKIEQIEEYIKQYGWQYEKKVDGTWYFIIEIGEIKFPIIMKCSENWFLVSCVKLYTLPKSKGSKRRVVKRLLELNRELKMAKIGIDDEGDVVMSVEYPIKNMSYSEFRDSLDALTTYLKHYWVPEIKTNYSGLVI